MAQLVVRNLEEDVLVKLKTMASANKRSTEAEVRNILVSAVANANISQPSLVSLIGSGTASHFDPVQYVNDLREEWN